MTASNSQSCGIASLLSALSFASGLALGARLDHGLKTAFIGLTLADALGLWEEDREAVFYGALLKDVGCTACAAGIASFFPDDELAPRMDMMLIDPTSIGDMLGWLGRNLPVDARLPGRIARFMSFAVQCQPVITEAMRGHCEIAQLFAQRLGFPEHVQNAVRYQSERWDGRGMAYGIKGNEIPLAARILQLSQVLEIAHGFGGRDFACDLARRRSGKRFDPELATLFLRVTEGAGFWELLEGDAADDEILAMQPPTVADSVTADKVEVVCEALAAFVDVKVPETRSHSTTVAELAVSLGRVLCLTPDEQTQLRHAALVHDLGKVAVPYGILGKGERSGSEWEQYRLHPYYTHRLLDRVPPLQPLAAPASSHHEWVNGQGYHRQLKGEEIPLAGRILSVANTYTHLTDPESDGGGGETALDQISALAGTQFDPLCVEALSTSVRGTGPTTKKARQSDPSGLSAREIEVLRLLVRGINNREIAEALVISRKTVEHHLDHIYTKLNVTSRTAAVAYAVQQHIA